MLLEEPVAAAVEQVFADVVVGEGVGTEDVVVEEGDEHEDGGAGCAEVPY